MFNFKSYGNMSKFSKHRFNSWHFIDTLHSSPFILGWFPKWLLMSMRAKFMVVVLRLSTPGDGRTLLVRPRVSWRIFKVIVVLDGFTTSVMLLCQSCCTNLSGDNHKNQLFEQWRLAWLIVRWPVTWISDLPCHNNSLSGVKLLDLSIYTCSEPALWYTWILPYNTSLL